MKMKRLNAIPAFILALLLIAGTYPFQDDKYDAAQHPRWAEVEPGHKGSIYAKPFDFGAYAAGMREVV